MMHLNTGFNLVMRGNLAGEISRNIEFINGGPVACAAIATTALHSINIENVIATGIVIPAKGGFVQHHGTPRSGCIRTAIVINLFARTICVDGYCGRVGLL